MKQSNIYSLALSLAGLGLIAASIMYFQDNIPATGLALILFFIALAIGVRGTKTFKAFSYTIWIFAAVSASMFYPQYFTSIGNFQLKTMIVPLLQVIMFGMGSQMSFEDFTGVIKMPKGVIIGVGAHYIIMPLVAFGIAHIFDFPPEIAAGIILIGTVPSGLASNVMSYLAHANLPLAVTIGAISTIISPFVTPLLMQWLGGQYIQVDFWHMMLDILNMIIMPIVAGFMFNLFSKNEASQKSKIYQLIGYFIVVLLTNLVYMKSSGSGFEGFLTAMGKSLLWFYVLPMVGAIVIRKITKGEDKWMGSALSMISMVGIAAIIAIITAAGRDSLLQVGLLLIITSLLHNLAGYSLGYGVSWVAGMPEKDRRTVAFEVGMQNGGLASGLALQMGKIATVGLAPAIFGPLMNVTGSALASWWRSRPPVEDGEEIVNKK
ncbi:MAG: bile acid:sodium symporter family protein [Sphingobacterium thalpophilum]